MQEQLYTMASIIASPCFAISNGTYRELQAKTGLKAFVASFVWPVAAEAKESEYKLRWLGALIASSMLFPFLVALAILCFKYIDFREEKRSTNNN